MSYLSDFKRTKSKTLRKTKQTEDGLNKSAVWSSANNTNKRLIFLKFNSQIQQLLTFLQIYMPFTFEIDTGKDVLAIDIYNFIRA